MRGKGSFSLRLDRQGIAGILKNDLREMVDDATERIADNVRGRLPGDVTVETRAYTTDRAAGSVTIADLRGMAYQARDGVLTRGATSIGAEVTSR